MYKQKEDAFLLHQLMNKYFDALTGAPGCSAESYCFRVKGHIWKEVTEYIWYLF